MEHHDTRRAAQLKLLTQTAPDTLMGKLLRTFWHPVAIADGLAPGTARSLRILCEDLTLYRGASGKAFVVGGACAHRCSALHTGWVQEDQIRCMYHGWRYDGTGVCTEQPAEKHLQPGTVRIAGYPVHEYAGLIFAYLGAGDAPPFDLPRKDALEEPGISITQHEEIWDCNWLQQVENSLDSTHLSFVHQWPEPSRLGQEIGDAIPELEYEETDAGIRQTARRPNSERTSNWTFPNCNNILSAPPRPGDPWVNVTAWQVPIDDENTLRIGSLAYPGGEVGEEMRRNGAIMRAGSMQHYKLLFEEHRLPETVGAADRIMSQDYVAVRGQGRIHDRTQERLGASDAGIALLRRIIFRELDAIRDGRPTKVWRKIPAPKMQTIAPVGIA